MTFLIGAVLGGIIGVVLAVPIALALGLAVALLPLSFIVGALPSAVFGVNGLAAFVTYLIVVAIFYAIAHIASWVTSTPAGLQPSNPFEEVARAAMIAMNAAMNVFLLPAAFAFFATTPTPLAGPAATALPLALLVAVPIGIVNLLAVIPFVSNNTVYQVVLAWVGLAMPMTWPVTLLGFVVWLLNLLPLAPNTGSSDFTAATWVTHGGWVYVQSTLPRAAYNLAHFTQVPDEYSTSAPTLFAGGFNPATVPGVVLHEGAHNFSAAAFGWWFALVGLINEYALPGPTGMPAGTSAYAELFPEGRRRASTLTWYDLWAPAIGAPPNGAPTVGTASVGPVCAFPGQTIALDATTPVPTTDPDAQPLGALWVLTPPAGSSAAIASPNSLTTSFVPDVAGDYVVALMQTDGIDGTKSVFAPDDTITVVPLDTSAVHDTTVAQGLALPQSILCAQAVWSIVAKPATANANINLVGLFTTDTPGPYTLRLSITLNGETRTADASFTVTP